MPELTWSDLTPEPALLAALEFADVEASREAIRVEVDRIGALASEAERKRERAVLRDMRKRWSERFATACATMIGNELRRSPSVRNRYTVSPDEQGAGQETFTPLGYKKGKRIDVVVFGPLVGLQIGVSLKGLNFADDASGNHDKNLTGRLYELRDEVSTVHDYLPRAFMAIVFFMPIAGCFDKAAAPSSFAHLVAELRARTGRLDPSVPAHAWRCDFAAVGLYAPGDPVDIEQGLAGGTVRYFPVADGAGDPNWPPRRGLPAVGTTLGLRELTSQLVSTAIKGSATSIEYAPAEGDSTPGLWTPASEDAAELGGEYDADDEEDVTDEETLEVDDRDRL
jgi:hypothetical protein